jgi:hypothetical protein
MATYSKVILSGQPLSYPTLVTATSTTLASGIYVTSVASPTTTTATVTTATLTAPSNVITYTTSASHSFVVGQLITITGLSGTNSALANLANIIITSVPSATTFTASVPYSPALSVALTTQTGTATSYNAVYTTTSTVQFATTQLVTVTNLLTSSNTFSPYNVSSSPIIAVGGSSGSYTFTTPVLSTTTGALTSQTGIATASPTVGTFIHNNTGAGLDEVWLYANNLSNAATQLTLQYGIAQTGASPFISGQQIITIPAQSGLTLITPGLILSNSTSSVNNSAIYAYASAANVIALSGYVNRIV